MTPAQRTAKEKRIRSAMADLAAHPNFASFIDMVRDFREVAIEDACTDKVVKNQNRILAALGEVRAYKSIISAYEEAVANRLEQVEAESE
jgi:hypothetical protein